MLVDMTLGDLDGVIASRTDHATGETVVTYDDDVISIEQMVQAVQSAGYEAEPVG
jgi:copper chaperone CopZ